MGVADYGLGVTPYAYNSSYVAGVVTFNSPPNATNPGGYGVTNPTANGERLGYIGSPYTFGIQLNTVGVNLSIPGTNDQGQVWAQNVVNWNDSSIHFVQDTWNASAGSDFGWNLDSIYSGCGTDQAGVNYILEVYGGVLQCSEGNVPMTAADYPVTITVYDNFTTNAQDMTQLVYGYHIVEQGSGVSLSGAADTVVFANPTGVTPPNHPANTVNPFSETSTFGPGNGIFQESEIVIVGGIGGDNAAFSAINGTVSLEYTNTSSGTWKNVPSAYNFGGDTGETSNGIASYWTPSHQLVITQGPTMLYGLWNSEPQVRVASGGIHIAGSISPSFGFVFMSNTAPVLNPWDGVSRDNMSWLPTASDGSFSTYLPPLSAPWTTTYHVQAFAAGYAETNTTVTGATTSLTISLSVAAGEIRAPLYMSTAAQASALAAAVGASSSAPYTFSDLTIDMNFTFAHVNDWNFPEFEVFKADGAPSVLVNNSYQGPDSSSGFNYIADTPYGASGVLVGAPHVFLDYGPVLSNINIYDGANAQITNQVVEAICLPNNCDGAAITLWRDTGAFLNNTIAVQTSWGIWVGNSVNTEIDNTIDLDGWGVSEFANTGTTVYNLTDAIYGRGVETLAGTGSTYNWFNVTEGSIGFEVGYDFGAGPLYQLPGTADLTVENFNVTVQSLGGNLSFSDPTTINNVQVWDPTGYSLGFQFEDDVGVTVSNLVANGSQAILSWNTTDLTLNDPQMLNTYVGMWGYYDTNLVINSAVVYNDFGGIVEENGNGYTATGLSATGCVFCFEIDYSAGPVSVAGLTAESASVGFNFDWSSGGTFSDISMSNENCVATDCSGMDFYGSSDSSVNGVTATDGSLGVLMWDGATGDSATNVAADSDSTGVSILSGENPASNDNTVSQVTATNGSEGVYVDPCSGIKVSGVTVSSDSLGVDFVGATWSSATGITASDMSLGVVAEGAQYISLSSVTVSGYSIGAIVADSQLVTVSGVTATDTTLVTPWTYWSAWGAPTAAVDTFDNSAVTVTGVTATMYPVALYDFESQSMTVGTLNATGGWYGVELNGTENSLFTGIGAYQDFYGIVLYSAYSYAQDNTVTQSSFVDDTSYGIADLGGEYNLIYDNSFIGNNGATGTYDPAHVQAYSLYYDDYSICTNEFCTTGIGNYWADWRTYGPNGHLAPFPVSGGSIDYFPLGPQETFTVSFTETGLPAGTVWSVSFAGMTLTAGTSYLNFSVPMGTYSYDVGSVAGYTASPSSGSVTVAGTFYNVQVSYSAVLYAVTLSEGGLSAGTSWGATVNSQTQSTTGATLTFYLPAGSYTYSFNAVSGYNLPATGASGTVVVTNAPVSLATSYSPTSTPSYVQTSDFNNWLAVAIAVAVIALVIGLLALFLRRRKEPPAQGAQAWTPPSSGGSPPASGGSSGWSEGPPSGGSPPS
jgi:hypothetical protein